MQANVDNNIDLDEVCGEVFFDLDMLDVHDLWDRSGESRYGYTSPDDAAVEMVEAELEPYSKKIERYFELKKLEEAKLYCMGVLKGIYRFSQESTSDFKVSSWDINSLAFRRRLQ